jgi:hypothetical protein
MYGWIDGQGNFLQLAVVDPWKYQAGDWVVEPGLPDHHLRVIEQFFDANGARWYTIFDTSLREQYGDYRWRNAEELERLSNLKARPEPQDLPAILARAASCRGIAWSMLARTDCESIQGWIHSGDESDRWSAQVWLGIGLGVFALASNQPRR